MEFFFSIEAFFSKLWLACIKLSSNPAFIGCKEYDIQSAMLRDRNKAITHEVIVVMMVYGKKQEA